MLNLPHIIIDLIDPFAPCFYGVTTWMKAQILLIGAILTPGSGRPRKKGQRLPPPTHVLHAPDTVWTTVALYSAHPSTPPRQASWYPKTRPTISDALALVRQSLWSADPTFRISREKPDVLKIPKPLFNTLISTLCYAA